LLFDKGLNKILHKKNMFPEILKKNPETGAINVASMDEIYKMAKKVANGDDKVFKSELSRLFKGKAVISLTPFLFSIGVMGIAVAALNRFWTQYRFNKGIGREQAPQPNNNLPSSSAISFNKNVFKDFIKTN